MNAKERLLNAHFEDVIYFVDPGYDDALIGVTALDNRAVYDYEEMIRWLVKKRGMEWDDAIDFIEHNTSYAYFEEEAPIIIFRV